MIELQRPTHLKNKRSIMLDNPSRQCAICDDYGWRWTTEQPSGWYLKAESKPRIDVGYRYTKKVDCACGQPPKDEPAS